MYKSYNSDTKVLITKCVKCSKEEEIKLSFLQLYSAPLNEGLFIRFPQCECSAVCTVYTGANPGKGKQSCHNHCVIAKAAFLNECGILLLEEDASEKEERKKVEEKLDSLGSTYENKTTHQQFLGNALFIFPEPKDSE
jgi:hypothetical protein